MQHSLHKQPARAKQTKLRRLCVLYQDHIFVMYSWVVILCLRNAYSITAKQQDAIKNIATIFFPKFLTLIKEYKAKLYERI